MSEPEARMVHLHISRETKPEEFAERVSDAVIGPMFQTYIATQPDPGTAAWESLCALLGCITGYMCDLAGPQQTAQLLQFAANSTAELPAGPRAGSCNTEHKRH